MKKSKIIVPALAVLCLSTAAAVSGTVAWFASSRNTSFNATNVTVINPEGELNLELFSGYNTTAKKSPETAKYNNTIAINEDTAIRDASVNCVNPTDTTEGFDVYRAITDDEGNAKSFQKVAKNNSAEGLYSQGVNKDGVDIVYCVTWSGDFWVEGSSNEPFSLFFDQKNSSLTPTVDTPDAATGTNQIFNAYRCAMWTAESEAPVVWAPKQSADALTYVDSEEIPGVGEEYSKYTKAAGETVSEQSTKTSSERKTQFLGTVYSSGAAASSYTSGTRNTFKLKVNFVAWFEGTDSACTGANLKALKQLSSVTAMSFNAIQNSNFVDAD